MKNSSVGNAFSLYRYQALLNGFFYVTLKIFCFWNI